MEKVLKKYNIFLKRKGLSVRGEEYYMWHTKKFFEYTGAKINAHAYRSFYVATASP